MKEKSRASTVLLISIIFFLIVLSPVKAGATAKPEGTLIAALPTMAEEGFLPDRCSTTTTPLWECVYDFLIYSDSSTMKPIPGVAERWEYSKDYRSLTFYLRKGIQFHDGWGELTAEDVKWTIEFNGRKGSRNVVRKMLQNIKSMEVVDPYTLVIHLKKPDPILWLIFCTSDNTTLPVLCKKYIETVGEEKANRQPIGSGPYRLVEQRMGDYAKFEALEKHWLVVPEFKYIILRLVPEESTRIAMLKTGEIDIAIALAIGKLSALEKAGLRPVVLEKSLTQYIIFGGMLVPEDKRYVEGYHRKDPWVDKRVREAINIAIDRKALVKTFYPGTGAPSRINYTLPGWEELEPIPYDPERAKRLLAEAGYPNGFSFKLHTDKKDPLLPFLAEAAAGYWKAIGLTVEIVPGDYATFRAKNKKGKTAGWLYTKIMPNRVDWSSRIYGHDLPNSSTPYFLSAELTAAIEKFLAECDPQKREAYGRELAQLYRSLYNYVPLVYAPRLHGVSKKVGEWRTPSRYLNLRNFIFARHAKPLNTWRLFTP